MEKNKNTQVNYSRQKTEFVYKLKTNRPSLRTKCRRPLLAAPRILPCPPKMSLRTSPQTGVAIRTPRAPHFLSRVGGGDCPPSCQPISTHCRGRQSVHFLETASLLPPPAALRRFPRPPMRCGIGKTGVAEPPPLHNFKKIRRQAPKLSVFNFPLSTYLIPRPFSRFFRT